jgi:hypothetical protein
MLSQNISYNDLGDLYLDKLNKHHLTRNLVHRLERLARISGNPAAQGSMIRSNPLNPQQQVSKRETPPETRLRWLNQGNSFAGGRIEYRATSVKDYL